MPCACCGSGCCGCSATPANWTLTVAGLADGTCVGCANYNGTFNLASLQPCIWVTGLAGFCPNTGDPYEFRCDVDGFFRLYVGGSAGTNVAVYKALSAFNCLGTNVLTLESNSGLCTNLPGTITVSPA
jgi:hypothetical protein